LLIGGFVMVNLAYLRTGVLAGALACAAPAHAQERTAVKQGFELQNSSGKKILLFRPAVRVGAQSTGGMFEPNADWTDKARANIETALAKRQASLGNTVVSPPESYGEQDRLVEEYTNLFGAVARAVVSYQFFVGNRLPTKKRDNKAGVFDWSLGDGVRDLPGAKDADYALFIYNKDAFGSTGRKGQACSAAPSVCRSVSAKRRRRNWLVARGRRE
jgi:hypothetical protein